MRHILIHAVVHAAVYASSLFASAAPPKLSLTASKATTSGGTSINVSRDERVTIQVAAEVGSTISVVTFPEFTYISPANKSEITFYASVNARVVVVAFRTGEASQQKIDIVVSGGPLPPGPGPGPGPTPGPVPPTSTIGKAAYDAAMKVESPARAADAATVAKGMRAVHAKAVAVATMTSEDIMRESITAFANLPAASKLAWVSWGPVMFRVLEKEITGSAAEKRLKAISAVEEMAKALEAVR